MSLKFLGMILVLAITAFTQEQADSSSVDSAEKALEKVVTLTDSSSIVNEQNDVDTVTSTEADTVIAEVNTAKSENADTIEVSEDSVSGAKADLVLEEESVDSVASSLAVLNITSNPESTSIYLDDEFIGLTPITLDSVDPGKHTIMLKKSGYYVKKATLNVKASSSADINFDLIKPATLKIVSQPAGAVVSLNGKMVGQTPFDNSKLKPGKYEISVQLAGFPQEDTTITFKSGDADSLFFTFGEVVKDKSKEDVSTSEDKSNDEKKSEDTEEKSKLEKVLNKVAIGVFAAFTALILLIELSHNND